MYTGIGLNKPLWNTINEEYWNPFFHKNGKTKIIRVRPGTPEYDDVVQLRYDGFIRSGYLKKGDDIESMQLPRDKDSIILAIKDKKSITATLTLNTPSPTFPGLAIELEKGVVFHDMRIRRPDIIEFVKASTDAKINSVRNGVNLFLATCIIANVTKKFHFVHVSRVVPEAMRFMRKFGFVYDQQLSFNDKLLNNTPSCIGYCQYSSIALNPEVPATIKSFLNILDSCNLNISNNIPIAY